MSKFKDEVKSYAELLTQREVLMALLAIVVLLLVAAVAA